MSIQHSFDLHDVSPYSSPLVGAGLSGMVYLTQGSDHSDKMHAETAVE